MAHRYWDVVSLDYEKKHAWVVRRCYWANHDDKEATNDLLDDVAFDPAWAIGKSPGLYKVRYLIDRVFDLAGKYDPHFRITNVKQLYEYQSLGEGAEYAHG